MSEVFTFPNPVNEVAARVVAAGAVVMAATYLLTGSPLVLGVLTYGFIARVASGPTLSPLGRLATQVVVPLLSVPPRLVAGPPKRFAQGIGATFTAAASIAHIGGATTAAQVLVGAIAVAASLEAVVGFCLGCRVFAVLMRTGIIPDDVCRDCADISRRIGASA